MKTAALCGISAWTLALVFLAGQPAANLPQALSGGDFLSVLLGDAKAEISSAFVHEADSYFHGGIDMECHELKGHGHEHGEVAHDHDAHDHGTCGHGADCHCGHVDEPLAERGFDPWHWINSNIRAPEIERHLEGEKAVEMMPWFWAAVKADPHNEEAWSTAWYVASHMMKDKHLALKIAEEGWRLNPSSMEIACAVGRSCRDKETFDAERSERMFARALDMGFEKKEMTDKEQFSFVEALSYLADGAQKRKDGNALARLLEKAAVKTPGHPIVKSIKQKMNSL